MSQGGRFNGIALERVVFGRPAAEVVPGELESLGRSRACPAGERQLADGRCIHTNPRAIHGPEDVLEILELAA